MKMVKIECGKCGHIAVLEEDDFKRRLKKFMEPLSITFLATLCNFQCIDCWSVLDVVIQGIDDENS